MLLNLFKKNLVGVLAIAVVAFVGLSYYYFNQYQDIKNNPQKIAQEETQKLVATVGKLIILPEGEEPTIATVADPEKLKDQPFFARAKMGDKVLLYANARKAILYDPENNKIVEVAPIAIGTPAPSPAGE